MRFCAKDGLCVFWGVPVSKPEILKVARYRQDFSGVPNGSCRKRLLQKLSMSPYLFPFCPSRDLQDGSWKRKNSVLVE